MDTVVFDLDDTLYDRTQPLRKAFTQFNRTADIDFKLFLTTFQANSEIAFNYVKQDIWSLPESHHFRIKKTLQSFGVSINNEEAQYFQFLYENSQNHIEPYPYITETLDYLQKKGIQLLIITNGPVNHQRNKIKNLGLDSYFSSKQIIVSGEEGIAKPDTKIFRLAESRFNIEGNRTWYIGDSYTNDIIGATNAGWNTIWFNRNQEKDEHHLATRIISSTFELRQILRELFSP